MQDSPFILRLKSFFLHEMTSEQLACSQAIEVFLKDKNTFPVFVLTGYAGTGKTSLLGAIVKTLASYKIGTRLLAPTGKAAKVLSLKSDRSAFTIHKMIYRRKDKTDDFNAIQLTPNLAQNSIFIVDEASMIGDYSLAKDGNVNQRNLLEDLIEFVYSGKNCKLILLGDVGQLPPVGSSFSPALNKEYLVNHFPKLEIHEAHLTHVLRQESASSILKNATILRNQEGFLPQFEIEKVGNITLLNGEQLQDELESSFGNWGTEDTIIVTRSNKRANEYNNQIRARIFWYEDVLCNSDKLMVVKNNYFWLKDQVDIGFIANGETMIVKRIVKRETLYGFDFAHVRVVFPDYESIDEQDVIVHLETLQSDSPSLSRSRMKELFFEVEKDYYYELNKKKRYDLILANPHFNALQVKFSYAVTCHKSQGGQWENVFIDIGYLPEDSINEEYVRWLYTALTRAKSKVFMINFPKEQVLGGLEE
jgi:exodeoxyribonuclease-5